MRASKHFFLFLSYIELIYRRIKSNKYGVSSSDNLKVVLYVGEFQFVSTIGT